VTIREHFAGFKSHTTLLAASTAVLSMVLISVVGGTSGLAILGIVVAVGILVFVLAFWGFRQAFMRRSGGLGFR
jgi:ABC-type Co2+ transport system permease subunit